MGQMPLFPEPEPPPSPAADATRAALGGKRRGGKGEDLGGTYCAVLVLLPKRTLELLERAAAGRDVSIAAYARDLLITHLGG